jgi:hypothetical protein
VERINNAIPFAARSTRPYASRHFNRGQCAVLFRTRLSRLVRQSVGAVSDHRGGGDRDMTATVRFERLARDGELARDAFARRSWAGQHCHRNSGITKHGFAISRLATPELCWKFRPLEIEGAALSSREGAGKTGCALHPRSRVQKAKRTRTRAYRFSGSSPAFPAQWFYSLLRALPGDRLFCHHRRCDAFAISLA